MSGWEQGQRVVPGLPRAARPARLRLAFRDSVRQAELSDGGGQDHHHHRGRGPSRAKRGALVGETRDQSRAHRSRRRQAGQMPRRRRRRSAPISRDRGRCRSTDELTAAAASLPDSLWSSPPSLVLAHGLAGKGADAKSQRAWANWIPPRGRKSSMPISPRWCSPSRPSCPFMKRAGGGRIVLVSSTAGLSASPTAALSYSVSKAAVAALPAPSRA